MSIDYNDLSTNTFCISVIIPYYNHIKYIDECLQSIRNQEFENIEIIIINDCSTDGSSLYLKSIESKYKFRLFENKINIGCAGTIELGLEYSKGDFICVLGSDDKWANNRFPFQLEILLNTNYDIVYGNCEIYIEDSNKYFTPNLSLFKAAYNSSNDKVLNLIRTQDYSLPLLQSAIFKRDAFISVQNIRKNYKSDDWVVLISSFKNYNTCYVDKPMVIYRIHKNNSHNDYWKLLPNRFEVIADFTPVDLKDLAFANVLISMSDHMSSNHKIIPTLKYGIASLIINLSFINLKKFIINVLKLFY